MVRRKYWQILLWSLSSVVLIVAHRPVAVPWGQLTTGLPLQYTPTASNTTLRITKRGHNPQGVDHAGIYTLTVLSLAEIAISAAATNGVEQLRPNDQANATFASFYPSSYLHFMVTANDNLPIYVVTDVLRAMQELSHHLYLLELVFEVFSETSSTSLPIASGCLARNCGFPSETVLSRDLEYVDHVATNSTAAPSRRLQSSLASLARMNGLESVKVTYDHLMDPLSITDQSFADVADRILANVTDLVIANQGDGPLPLYGNAQRRLFHIVDTWGSNLAISLLPMSLPGIKFTLGQAAMALKATQQNLGHRSMMESRLKFMVDGTLVGWGCLRYTNTSSFRCFMPTAGIGSSVGSRKYRGSLRG